eukprot:jgi/Chlat1/6845/Chrsp51S06524
MAVMAGASAAAVAGSLRTSNREERLRLRSGKQSRAAGSASSSVRCTPGMAGRRASSMAVRMGLKPLVPEEFLYDNLNETQKQNYDNLPTYLGGSPRFPQPQSYVEESPGSAEAALEPHVPSSLYGLTSKQIQMFGLDPHADNFRQPAIKPEMLGIKANMRRTIPPIISGGPVPVYAGYSTAGGSRRSGGSNGAGPPPDLPSLLLNARILYIGMPLVPAVTELLVAQLLWLQYESRDKPIYVYINSPGTQTEDKKSVAFETEAFAVADSLLFMSCPVHTINVNKAIGQAALLLACGSKGCRHSQPNAKIVLEPPRLNATQGPAADLVIKAAELEENFISYVNILAYKTGRKPIDVRDYVSERRHLTPEIAIEYGLIDHVLKEKDLRLVERQDYERQMLVNQSQQRALEAQGFS